MCFGRAQIEPLRFLRLIFGVCIIVPVGRMRVALETLSYVPSRVEIVEVLIAPTL
jgi:hypothetical protein